MNRVRGARDYLPPEHAARQRILDAFRTWFEEHGYAGVELPIIEPTELYVRKGGGGLLTRLYSFVEPDGTRVSLRPEFTASAVRAYLAGVQPAGAAVRWHYAGPVFRFDPRAEMRIWTQAGVEAIGLSGVEADADLLGLAAGGLRRLGVGGWRLVLGHVGVFGEAIGGFGLGERTTATIVAGIDRLRLPAGREELRTRLNELGLTASDPDAAKVKQAIQGLGDEQARTVVRGLLSSMNIDLLGGRHPDQIVGRLLRKLGGWDDPATVERALQFAGRFAALHGAAEPTIQRARALLAAEGLAAPSLSDLEALVAAARRGGVEEIDVDFGLSRELGYYTGFVFDIRHPHDGGQPLCGGGRYDGLVRALGGPDVPAAGFAYNVNALAEALRETASAFAAARAGCA
ncbi:MAG: ATP phosphoribosyltransferase regulatory subunit [Chloroflexota bacterium]|nr:ATP phosphoribosyltransferase regulatory subunit [Dehalococcoidia bacterium]MDW8253959.1 ATP phosphoribosyltransferase regulatory subunit [Chloroflexota bacterium]